MNKKTKEMILEYFFTANPARFLLPWSFEQLKLEMEDLKKTNVIK